MRFRYSSKTIISSYNQSNVQKLCAQHKKNCIIHYKDQFNSTVSIMYIFTITCNIAAITILISTIIQSCIWKLNVSAWNPPKYNQCSITNEWGRWNILKNVLKARHRNKQQYSEKNLCSNQVHNLWLAGISYQHTFIANVCTFFRYTVKQRITNEI